MVSSNKTLNAYFTYLHDKRVEEGPKLTAFGTAGRGSMSGSCSRQIGLTMLDVPESDPLDSKTLLAFHIGTALHELTQTAMESVWKMESEVPIDLRPLDYNISGNADGVYKDEWGYSVIWELKSKTSFGFKLALKDNVPEKHELAQAAMYALDPKIMARSIHLVYLCKDSSYGKGATQMGQTIEWVLDLDQPAPGQNGATARELAHEEAKRITDIATMVLEQERIPERYVPDYGLVESVPYPDSKTQPWRCRFCRYNSLCAPLPTGVTPIKETSVQIMLDEREVEKE
jgi:hypothetical protein